MSFFRYSSDTFGSQRYENLNQRFTRGFLLYIVVVLGMGVSTNLEGFAKSVFNQESLNTFNKLNTGWLFLYFFVLQTLQTFDLEGVMLSYVIFYWMRCFIAVGLAARVDAQLQWRGILLKFLPSVFEAVSYGAALFLTRVFMQTGDRLQMKSSAFLVCGALGACHMAAVAFAYRSELKEFKEAIKN